MSEADAVSRWDAMHAASIAEASEARTYAALVRAARAAGQADVDVAVVSGATVLRTAGERSSTLLNRVLGVGLDGPVTEAALATLAAHYATAGVPWSIELSPAADSASTRELLKAARLRRGLETAVLAIDCGPRTLLASPITVRRADGESIERAAAIETDVFRVSPTVRRLLAAAAAAPLHQWLAFDGDEPAGACLTHTDGDVAWFGWSATLPTCRGRGVQAALLAHAVAHAGAQGCRWMTAETAVGTPDQPDASWRNMRRFGFIEVYRRHAYLCVPRKPAPPQRG